MLDPLYIGEPNTIFCEIRDADEANVTSATVTFSIKDAAGTVVGTANIAMAYVAARTRYEGTFSAVNSALLDEATGDSPNYFVWITATGYTLRKLERVAKYRGRI